MPAMITHLLCGQRVLECVDAKLANIVHRHRKLYDLGTQGGDMFFYRPWGATRGIGSRMHVEGAGVFLSSMAAGLKGLENDACREGALAYFAGFLTHYAMDCAGHPYVFYKTGFDEDGELTGVYKVYHVTFESAIDTLLLRHLESSRPIDKKWYKRLNIRRKHARTTAGVLSGAINNAYNTELKCRHALSAMAYMSIASRVLRSRWGIWRGIVGFVENRFTGDGVWTAMIHRQDIGDGIDYLNKGNKVWREPWDAESVRYDSFKRLFEDAADDAVRMIEAVWEYVHGKTSLDGLSAVLGDRSFYSGRPIKEQVVFKVHDVVFRR
ncbi:MAG: zinc dependent phospholipase C family protein [Defluviitaleaceae bacterium]|nr:zinc dependent phospholipase C family protein [Defluviitaleaceae bacterium]